MIKHFAAASLMVLRVGIAALPRPSIRSTAPKSSPARGFDFKVEFPDRVDPAKLKVTVNGEDHAAVFGQAAEFIEREDGKDQSALILRDVALAKPGTYTVEASDGTRSRERGVERLRHRAAQGEERDPVHRRRHVARAPRRPRGCSPRASRKARPSASSRSTTCRTWRWWRPPAAIRSSPIRPTRRAPMPPATSRRSTRWASMPTAPPIRSTIRRSRPSPASSSAGSAWRSASSPTPRSRTRRRPRWSRTRAGAPPMTRSSSSSSRPGPTC